MPQFQRYVGIDYSGAATPTDGLPGLRVYRATRQDPPVEEPPPRGLWKYSPRRNWTRKGLGKWLEALLSEDVPGIVGIDHGFSFPLAYFDRHKLAHDWPAFVDDFQRHWPTDEDNVYVEFVRDGSVGSGILRPGMARWRRLTELRAGGAKSVFHFDVQGAVAKPTHAGLPWLRYLRVRVKPQPHSWPFDGWDIPRGTSAAIEVYPRIWSRTFPKDDRNGHQQDAYSVARWLREADADGRLHEALGWPTERRERIVAESEGWILGVR